MFTFANDALAALLGVIAALFLFDVVLAYTRMRRRRFARRIILTHLPLFEQVRQVVEDMQLDSEEEEWKL